MTMTLVTPWKAHDVPNEIVQEALSILEDYAEEEPVHYDSYGPDHCCRCFGRMERGKSAVEHRRDCTWLRARNLLERLVHLVPDQPASLP